MSTHPQNPEHVPLPHAEDIPVPELEFDQDIAPRPEEEIADALRPEPDAPEHHDNED